MNTSEFNIVMMGATGAVGGEVVGALRDMDALGQLTLLGRRVVEGISDTRLVQHKIDVLQPETYAELLPGHEVAICTLGVGQPSKASKEQFLKIDKLAVIDFATQCKQAGVRHFELLSSVGANANSSSFYLKSKGELAVALEAMEFERLSIFEPSMILTPENRYGFMQGVILKVWPILKPILMGSLRKYRGVKVEQLGKAMVLNLLTDGSGVENLHWDNFQEIAGK